MTLGKKMSEKEMIKETFYLSHGNPILAVDEKVVARRFFEKWTEKEYPNTKQPKAILIVSAHWETQVPSVSAVVDHTDLIYDIAEVPPCTFQIKYPALGSPELARRVEELLKESGYQCEIDTKRGLDHASWVPLMLMYPEANIPVCQLSVQSHLDGTHHFNVGRALSPLKEDGYLIIGSGGAVHPSDDTPHFYDGVAPWAAEFDNWLEDALTNGRYEDVNNYKTKAPNWELAHPFPEHFYPLIVAMGASGENSKAELIHRSWDHGTLGYASYKFTSP